MKKQTKCKIGVTLLTPVVAAIIVAVCLGLCWLIATYKLFALVIIFTGLSGFVILIWGVLYEHCVESHEKEDR